MSKEVIASAQAPAAIGPYSQAIRISSGTTVYLSGQLGLDPASMQLAEGFAAQAEQVFKNLQAVAQAAGGSLADAVKINLYLTDLGNFTLLNDVMTRYCAEPFPARATVGVSALPRGALVEADAVLVLP